MGEKFNTWLVIAKCPYFSSGVDGNQAMCTRAKPFFKEKPNCSNCDIYKDLVKMPVH